MAPISKQKPYCFNGQLKTAILNADDPAVLDLSSLACAPSVRCWTYSQQAESPADFVALILSLHYKV
jgi:hypothetical protein